LAEYSGVAGYFPSGYHQVKPFYSERIVFNLEAKNTSLLTKHTAWSIKSMRKWQKKQNGGQFTIPLAKKTNFIWPRTTGFRRKY
jgi:hypothetical protein